MTVGRNGNRRLKVTWGAKEWLGACTLVVGIFLNLGHSIYRYAQTDTVNQQTAIFVKAIGDKIESLKDDIQKDRIERAQLKTFVEQSWSELTRRVDRFERLQDHKVEPN